MNEVSGVSDATAINLSSEKDDWNEWKRDEKSESWTGVESPFPSRIFSWRSQISRSAVVSFILTSSADHSSKT